ncbi:Glycosyltransferase involved in cell wall bisynthesis [Chryseobacterium soldanellicola]|uniref:Glycosyltransferase involved in cell wall bisynthesis n=1 Tax=Chryseobacterium soldanellicola TaxID=311333 RepID=A0A1H1DAM6_9FLAO|nr:glycosyltransferase family 4 protein [Chryseobacterium soldanellicola]SDQ73484.1 Glycosyltransferase involved in cell wall bisynthesis [Chryseobacterium soldanellicola]
MKILFIAPVPPPVNGQSKASKVLLDALLPDNEVEIVNLSKSSLKNGANSFGRFMEIVGIMKEVKRKRDHNDIIYLSLAESFAGNMRDLTIYKLCQKDLGKTFIHMLGGAGMKEILSKEGWQKKLNAKFMSEIAGVIVEGPINYEVFKQVMPEEKIHIVPNFAEDFLFVTDEEINKKFGNLDPIQLLYLSNLIPGKGYEELVDAYLSLSEEEQAKIKIKFVGGFESIEAEKNFLEKINGNSGIKYLGKFIDGEEKRTLYCESHVFCLPTYYPFEGQPISILEGYATGCVVITSNHSGIPFIFKNNENGFMVEKKSVSSLSDALKQLILEKENLKEIAFHNRNEALEKYRIEIYQKSILSIFSSK